MAGLKANRETSKVQSLFITSKSINPSTMWEIKSSKQYLCLSDRRSRLLFLGQVQQADVSNRRQLLELVERMLIYKFSNKSRQELEAMFGLTEWQQIRFPNGS